MEILNAIFKFILIASITTCIESKYVFYNTSSSTVFGKINVHLVAHTHDDVGWLKTFDQYYFGSNNTIQGACVQNVLDSMVPALLADSNRKFVYVEQEIIKLAYFKRWWYDQSDAVQQTVKNLVHSGQLEFINGGICMHDEGATHFIDMIDQTTLGHRFIKQNFNINPRIGWQIDPFGHSAVQAYLLGAEVGFDSLFFARIDYQDRAKRKLDKTLEVVWRGSESLGSSAQVFTTVFPDHYGPPNGFYFEIDGDSPNVQDNMNLYDYNVQERVNDFVAAALSQANITRTNHMMWTMGDDFNYQYAQTWFRNMDKLIHYVNQDGRVNALYSTPSIYTDAKFAANEIWPLKTGDFFPYADAVDRYFTGYFTSRPSLKGYVRQLSSYYLAARQLEFLKGKNKEGAKTDTLANALAVTQHHDAVTGTERQHVADDYSKMLSVGYKEAEILVSDSLAKLVDSESNSTTKFQQCPLLNITYCPSAEVELSLGKKLVIVVYNSLGWNRTDVVRIPMIDENVAVKDSSGKEIEYEFFPITNESISIRNYYATAYVGKTPSRTPHYWLAFSASVPPLGFNTYYLISSINTTAKKIASISNQTGNGTLEIGKGNLKLIYSQTEAKLVQYVNSRTSIEVPVNQSYSYYIANDGSGGSQASGAYMFYPNGIVPIKPEYQSPLKVIRGTLYDEVHQKINSWIYQVTRVHREKEHVEFEFTIGPIPIDDGIGKEIITQITTNINSNKTFYTDSNARDFLKRIRDYRTDWDLQVMQPIAGNYYPIVLGAYMKDENTELSVLVDRSVGGSSIVDGQLEFMLHRRFVHDDSGGLVNVLNETVCVLDECRGLTVQGKYYMRIDQVGDGAKWRRSNGQEIYSPFLLAFQEQAGDESTNFQVPSFSMMDPTYTLPNNIAIITLEELEDRNVLLRLAHLYEVEEDKDLSKMASVELKKVFYNRKISKIREMSLSANQERQEMEKKRLVWKVEGSNEENLHIIRGGQVDAITLIVEIAPMEIRTFIIDFIYENE